MAPETSEAWLTVAEYVGTFIGAAALVWWHSYKRGRAEEGDRGRDVPAKAVGAAFVDRAAADAMVGVAGDVRKIREIVEDVADQAGKDRIIEESRRAAREEI